MPAKPLTPEQKEDAARLKHFFKEWQKSLREAGKPMSQDAAAAKLGFGQSALSQYLNGSIPLNGEALGKLAGLMGVDPVAISPAIVASEKERSEQWLIQRDTAPSPSAHQVAEPAPQWRHGMRNRRPVWVVGMTQGGMTERIWTDGDFPVGELEEWADVSTTDEHAFACRVVGDSMVPRYQPGEYALVEPNTAPEIEDDVLVRLVSGQTMLKRLLSRRGGIRLGSYNSAEIMTFREDEVTWMYYVAHPIPTRRIRQRVDLLSEVVSEPDRRTDDQVAVEQRESARRLGGSQPSNAAKGRRSGGQS